ncbi:hypothetical protein FN846DRAFT_772524 [Sphaerosporella brunnea]|uniref:C2H2-type domain-containing protein n=1 Tax=Sphaerosporella brunnea TaxID=1250544 RepID=A0A5J5F8L5_9PEZI|nr:hypothetical protein FN846DRAFT_772524 [Sphaerosporella brunnea]
MQQNQPHQRQPHPQSVSGPPQQQQQQKQPQPPQLQQQQLQQQQLQHQQLQHQQLQQQQLQQQQQRQQQQQALQQPQQTHQGQRQEPSPEQILEKPPRKPDSIAHLVGTTKVRSPNREVDFKTDVDNLMKAIQAKQPRKDDKPPSPSYPAHHTPTNAQDRSGFAAPYHNGWPQQHPQQLVHKKPPKQKKRYECMLPGCGKSFFQKTHLDIHSRAHTGDKPFECSEPGCGQRFSQLGNLKTHERRHTGEKPYSCDYCGKRFAQRGNVRAHKIVHDGAKPFTCKLDNCLKQFTQLGNLKSHQNKFHSAALRQLTGKFANIRDTDEITAADRELFEYFAELYKNSNRGIKGRGKDRKISGVKKQPAVDTDVKQDMSMTSPNGSSASNGDHSYDFSSNGTHMDEDEDGSVGSPYEHQQQQLPPLRPGNDMGPAAMGMMTFGHGGEDPMNVHTHMAKYSLDRKFPL